MVRKSMRGSEFAYDSVDALYYNLKKASLSRGGSYIDSPKWLKNKKTTINKKKTMMRSAFNMLSLLH